MINDDPDATARAGGPRATATLSAVTFHLGALAEPQGMRPADPHPRCWARRASRKRLYLAAAGDTGRGQPGGPLTGR